ncbi:MAG: hypothetical protein R3268_03020 [Acidiferrobacterales bacterium]|nr:hypothetical protein [Acidiferrobacterales bacterium]
MLEPKRLIVLASLLFNAVIMAGITAWLFNTDSVLAKPKVRSQTPEPLCEHTLCRPPQTIRLMKSDGSVFESSFDVENPIVHKGWISIFPGETLFVEVDRDKNRLVNLRAVKQMRDPNRTLELRFWQEKGKPDMFLKVNNPFPKPMKYHAVMVLLDSDKLYKTSSCPVLAGKIAFERWPHAVFELLLFDFHLVEDGASKSVCEF